MRSIEEILAQARQLPADQRRKLVTQLSEEMAGAEDLDAPPDPAAMERFMKLAGTGHSEHTDVSSNKYKHLAEIYADKK